MTTLQRITITLAVMAIMSSCNKATLLSLPPLDETDDVCEKMKDIKFPDDSGYGYEDEMKNIVFPSDEM